VAGSARELARLQAQVASMRGVLIGLLQDVVHTESRMSIDQAAQLLEANEALVLASLRTQTDADTKP
jgi:hypothetical protein